MTQKQAAGYLGVSVVHLSTVENGHSSGSIELLFRMADVYLTTFTITKGGLSHADRP